MPFSTGMLRMQSIGGAVLALLWSACGASSDWGQAAEFADRGLVRDIVVVGTSPDQAATIASHAAAMRREIQTSTLS